MDARTLNNYCTESCDFIPLGNNQNAHLIEAVRSDYLKDLEKLRRKYATRLLKLYSQHGSAQSLLQ